MAYLFIDFDDTLSDPVRLNLQYVREAGSLLVPVFGGEAAQWATAIGEALEALEQEYIARFVGNPTAGYCAWLDESRARSVQIVFEKMGLPMPSDPDDLAKRTQFDALTGCDATFPGAYEALDALFQADYRVQLASGQESEYLLAALIGAGIESFTESKFGPDLVDCAKEGPEYYERIFAAVGVAASDVLVIDNQPEVLGWAQQTGAKTIQASVSPNHRYPDAPGVLAVLTDLNALPGLVKTFLG